MKTKNIISILVAIISFNNMFINLNATNTHMNEHQIVGNEKIRYIEAIDKNIDNINYEKSHLNKQLILDIINSSIKKYSNRTKNDIKILNLIGLSHFGSVKEMLSFVQSKSKPVIKLRDSYNNPLKVIKYIPKKVHENNEIITNLFQNKQLNQNQKDSLLKKYNNNDLTYSNLEKIYSQLEQVHVSKLISKEQKNILMKKIINSQKIISNLNVEINKMKVHTSKKSSSDDNFSGWQKINNKWIYKTNHDFLKNEWKKINGKWYYFNNNHYMVTFKNKINGKWYLFDKSGYLK